MDSRAVGDFSLGLDTPQRNAPEMHVVTVTSLQTRGTVRLGRRWTHRDGQDTVAANVSRGFQRQQLPPPRAHLPGGPHAGHWRAGLPVGRGTARGRGAAGAGRAQASAGRAASRAREEGRPGSGPHGALSHGSHSRRVGLGAEIIHSRFCGAHSLLAREGLSTGPPTCALPPPSLPSRRSRGCWRGFGAGTGPVRRAQNLPSHRWRPEKVSNLPQATQPAVVAVHTWWNQAVRTRRVGLAGSDRD